jgi:hypothetical protein
VGRADQRQRQRERQRELLERPVRSRGRGGGRGQLRNGLAALGIFGLLAGWAFARRRA